MFRYSAEFHFFYNAKLAYNAGKFEDVLLPGRPQPRVFQPINLPRGRLSSHSNVFTTIAVCNSTPAAAIGVCTQDANVFGIYTLLPNNEGAITNEHRSFIALVEAVSSPYTVETPGTAPGSKAPIPTDLYRHSREPPTKGIVT